MPYSLVCYFAACVHLVKLLEGRYKFHLKLRLDLWQDKKKKNLMRQLVECIEVVLKKELWCCKQDLNKI